MRATATDWDQIAARVEEARDVARRFAAQARARFGPRLREIRLAQLLARLEDARETSDYSASVRFTEEEARNAVSQARAFIALCGPLMP